VGHPNHLIPGLFHAAKDVIGESTEVISDVERGGDRSLPSQVAGDLRPAYFHGVYSRSRVLSQDCPKCSIRGVEDVCPKHFGQRNSPQLGGDVGISSTGRAQEIDQGGE